MDHKWTHDTTVTVTWPIPSYEEGEVEYESDEIAVRLYVKGKVTDDPEIGLERFEIWTGITTAETRMGYWRAPVASRYPDSNDQGVIDAVESWFAGHGDECWESLDEGDDE